jgi:hypothetical protein
MTREQLVLEGALRRGAAAKPPRISSLAPRTGSTTIQLRPRSTPGSTSSARTLRISSCRPSVETPPARDAFVASRSTRTYTDPFSFSTATALSNASSA